MDEAMLFEAIERINRMEMYFNVLKNAEDTNPFALTENPLMKEYLDFLIEYYENGQWLYDYELDEQGLLPENLKRGILSQDAMYDFLDRIKYIAKGESKGMVEELFEELAALPQIEAIALGGSRAGEIYDDKSDYDVYLYCTSAIEEDVRRCILEKYCSFMEIGNHFWEYEDNCVLKNEIDIDILYRNLDDFAETVASVVEQYQAYNGYTTCMWHNLKTCKIIYDRDGRLQAAKDRFSVPYPKRLKHNIISKNMKLISDAMPAYRLQIAKAVERKDLVSIGHRTAAFMESYFDIIWAMNELTHPGEKRLVSLCKKQCNILPANFEENINQLYADLFTNLECVDEDIDRIITELKKLGSH